MLKIESGIPLPTYTHGWCLELLAKMKPGQSVLLANYRKVTAFRIAARRRGIAVLQHKEKGGVRVWVLSSRVKGVGRGRTS
jgi:hypothetical protein